MKVLMISPLFRPAIGGTESSAFELSRGLVRRGHDVTVWTSNRLSPVIGSPRLPLREEMDGIRVFRWRSFVLPFLPRTLGFFFPGAAFESLTGVKEFDVVYCHEFSAFSTYGTIWGKSNPPVPVIVQATASIDGMPQRALFDRTLGRFILSRSSAIVCMTEAEKRYFASLGMPESRLVVSPSGVDLSRFSNLSDEVQTELGLDSKTRYVLFLGRLAPNKGLRVLVEAARLVNKEDPTLAFLLAGEDQGEGSALVRMAESYGLTKMFRLLGRVSQLQASWLLAHSLVVVLPSLYGEAEGLVLVEAMAAGRPVVASRLGGIPYVVRDGENGTLVTPGDPVQLGAAIAKVTGDPDTWQRMHVANLARARDYAWENVVSRIERLCRQVALPRRGG